MAVDWFSFAKGTLILKTPKRSPLMLRILLVTVLMCSFHMFSTCFKQIKIHMRPELTRVKPICEQHYDPPIIGWEQTEAKIKQALFVTKPIEERSYGATVGAEPELAKTEVTVDDLRQKVSRIEAETVGIKAAGRVSYNRSSVRVMETELEVKPELPRFKPLEEHLYHPKVVDLERKSSQVSPKLIRIKHNEQHRYEPETEPETKPKEEEIDMKQTEIKMKPESMKIRGTEQHSHDQSNVGLKQDNVQVKPASERLKPVEQHAYGHTIAGSNQTKPLSIPELVRNQQLQLPCQNPGISVSEMPYVHYPVPTNYSREECACTPVRSYVIVTMQRSGSKWLESLLNSHTNVSSNGELFYVRERRANVSILRRTLDEVFNLDWQSGRKKKGCIAAVGFKWMLNQGILGQHEQVSKYFAERGVSVIFLFRRNLLRRWISLLANTADRKTLNESHKAHVFTQQEAEQLANYKPILKPKSLVRKLRRAASSAQEAIDHFRSIRHMVLYYEDLVKNITKLTDVMDFLGVPKRNLNSHHVKIHTMPLPQLVRNWSAVQKALKGTEFESFLESDY